MDQDQTEFVGELQRGASSPGDTTYLRSGVVTAVDRATNLYTVTLGGTPLPNIKCFRGVLVDVGDTVEILVDDTSYRIIGVVGLNEPANTYVEATATAVQSITTGAWTTVTMAFSDGVTALWDDPNDRYLVPKDGLYNIVSRIRVNDGQTAGLNVGMGVGAANGDNEIWNMIPTVGANRRLVLVHAVQDRFTAGQGIRASFYSDGATTQIINRSLSIVRLGP